MVLSSLIDSSECTIMKEIQKVNKDLRNSLEATETRLLVKFGYQNKKIRELEEDNRSLKNKIELLERSNKNNNIVVFGLQKNNAKILKEEIAEQLNRLLHTELKPCDIKHLYYIGKSERPPVKIELVSDSKKWQILKSSKHLKGTGIRISEDLTPKQREELKTLKIFLMQEKQKGIYKNCYIKRNKLILGNEAYTCEQLLKMQKPKIEKKSSRNEFKQTKEQLEEKTIPVEKKKLDQATEYKYSKQGETKSKLFGKVHEFLDEFQKKLETYAKKF